MVAVGDTPTEFSKIVGWEIAPDSSLGQKNDFRDPQAYYDPETGIISMAREGKLTRYIDNKALTQILTEIFAQNKLPSGRKTYHLKAEAKREEKSIGEN